MSCQIIIADVIPQGDIRMGIIWESTEIPVITAGKGWLALDKPAEMRNLFENDLDTSSI